MKTSLDTQGKQNVVCGLLELTVSSNEGFDAFTSPLTQPVHHEEQQREDEEG